MARILIVDDSEIVRKVLMEMLTDLGHKVVGEAVNGSQAFVEYLRLKPDLLTMDLTMPGMRGVDAIAKIVATFPNAKVVVISALEEREAVLEALEKGARHFIIKPITAQKVDTVIQNVLQQDQSLERHLGFIKKLRGIDDGMAARKINPPFQILRTDKLTMVDIGCTISVNSCLSLSQEIQGHLAEQPSRVLLNFGDIDCLEKPILMAIDTLIGVIEQKSGIVKAICNNPDFAQQICSEMAGDLLRLSSALHTLAAKQQPNVQ